MSENKRSSKTPTVARTAPVLLINKRMVKSPVLLINKQAR